MKSKRKENWSQRARFHCERKHSNGEWFEQTVRAPSSRVSRTDWSRPPFFCRSLLSLDQFVPSKITATRLEGARVVRQTDGRLTISSALESTKSVLSPFHTWKIVKYWKLRSRCVCEACVGLSVAAFMTRWVWFYWLSDKVTFSSVNWALRVRCYRCTRRFNCRICVLNDGARVIIAFFSLMEISDKWNSKQRVFK